jgi:hypothetical protein
MPPPEGLRRTVTRAGRNRQAAHGNHAAAQDKTLKSCLFKNTWRESMLTVYPH